MKDFFLEIAEAGETFLERSSKAAVTMTVAMAAPCHTRPLLVVHGVVWPVLSVKSKCLSHLSTCYSSSLAGAVNSWWSRNVYFLP